MTSVTTMSRMRRGALVLAAAAVMVGVRMFSAAPAMADPLVMTEPTQPVTTQTAFDNDLGLIGLDNGFVNFDNFDNGFVSFDHDSDHANADHDSGHANADHDSGHATADRR